MTAEEARGKKSWINQSIWSFPGFRVFHYTYRAASFGLNNIFYLESQAERLVSKVGRGRKKLGCTFFEGSVFVSVGFFPHNRPQLPPANWARLPDAEASIWLIDNTVFILALYARPGCGGRNLFMKYLFPCPELHRWFPTPECVRVRVSAHTSMLSQDFPFEVGRLLWFNTHRGKARTRRERQLYFTDRKKEKRHWAMKYASVDDLNNSRYTYMCASAQRCQGVGGQDVGGLWRVEVRWSAFSRGIVGITWSLCCALERTTDQPWYLAELKWNIHN